MMEIGLLATNPQYFSKILNWKNINYEFVGNLYKIDGFKNYNNLLDINSVFSTYPFGEIIDRTKSTNMPFKYKVLRDWKIPTSCLSFEDLMYNQVMWHVCSNKKINLCWSGGIDSTTMLVAFIKHAPDLSQLRVIYSPFSVYENQKFLEMLHKNYPQVETLDISGTIYLDTNFDGIFINGHGGDEFAGSLDDSFYDRLGGNGLYRPWKDYFQEQGKTELIEFCENNFAKSGKQIETVLDSRWWFYASNKSQVFQISDNIFLTNQQNVKVEDTIAFYDNYDFESFMYFNPQLIIEDRHNYKTHKNFMKKYIFDFDKNEDYFINKSKSNSLQFAWYTIKKTYMLDMRWIARLADSSIIKTPNLPFFSKKEFDRIYSNSLDYLFNEPDHV